MMRLAMVSVLFAALGAQAAEPTVMRVQSTAGGPQIHVAGKPIPPRFFWGAPGGGRVDVTEAWTTQQFDLRVGYTPNGQVTLHFRFGHVPGTVDLADVRIIDVASGQDVFASGSVATAEAFAQSWSTWPVGPANTVGKLSFADGGLRVTLTAPPGGAWPDFHLHSRAKVALQAHRQYRVSFRAKATPARSISPAVYHVAGGAWSGIGGPAGYFVKQVALARDAGVNLVSFSAPNCWTEPNQPVDWTPLDDVCRQVLAVNPKALLVPRVGADAPGWWLQRHPTERMVFDDGPDNSHASPSSRLYRAEAAAHLEKLCQHLLETFPEQFAGVHPCGQHTGEFFYEKSWARPLSGYDASSVAAFRDWLKEKGDPAAATALPPTAPERRAHPCGFLRDPAKERRLLEFARFQQHEMADLVLTLAAACRRGTAGKKLVVFFYGYLFEFPPLQNGAPTAGHYDLERVLASPDIDILCSPISYTDREWPGTAPCMTAAESVKAAGKLWLNEDDTRTFLDPRKEGRTQEGTVVNVRQTKQLMLRNTAQAALRGFGTWWMDLPAQGWFNDARIWAEQVRLNPVEQVLLGRPQPFTPEIAALVDEDSMCHLTGGSGAAMRPLIYEGRAAIGRSGAPYGQYLLRDALSRSLTARLQIFLAAWAVKPGQTKALILNRPAGVTRVWCYAPGYVQDDRLDVRGMTDLTGLKHTLVEPATAQVTPTAAGTKVGLTGPWGPQTAIRPLLAAEPAGAEVWATYADGSAAVVVRRGERGHDVFVGVPQLTPALVRALAKLAGVHLFCQQDTSVWAAEGYLSLHAMADGPLSLDTGVAGPVTDALDGKLVGQGPRFNLDIERGETRVLKYR